MDIFAAIFFGVMLVGSILWAVLRFLRMPREWRYKLSSREHEHQLLEQQKATGVVVLVPPKKREAIVRALPVLAIWAPLLAFGLYVKFTENFACSYLLGINGAYLALAVMSVVIPVMLLAWSIGMVNSGIKTVRSGYYPPLDTVSYFGVFSRKGLWSTVRGWTLVFMPLLMALFVCLGFNVYAESMHGATYTEFEKSMREKCITIR